MKKVFMIFLSVLFIVSPITIYSHPGRTDANGGHWDRKNGTYHFHTGEYAGKSSSGSTSNNEYKPFTPPYDPPTDNPYRKQSKTFDKDYSFFDILGIILCSVFAFSVVASIIYNTSICIYEVFLEKHLPKYKISNFSKKIDIFLSCGIEITKLELELSRLTLEFKMPSKYEISSDGLPKEKNCSDWGSTFTLYQANKGGKFHFKYNCSSATIPKHIYRYYNLYNFTNLLCQKCAKKYVIPDMSWYADYLSIQKLKIKLDKLRDEQNRLQNEIAQYYKKCNSLLFKFLMLFSKKNKGALLETNKKYVETLQGADHLE